jgi:tRNA(Arg) A34 adenosine deaminase TadA
MQRRTLLGVCGAGLTTLSLFTKAARANESEASVSIVQPEARTQDAFIARAFEMRRLAREYGDQSYGAVVVMEDEIIGESWSRVILDQDPTAHAEISAIRDAARRINSRNLASAVLYSSSAPCPMCEAAAYWAEIETLIYGRQATNAGAPRLCD